MACDVLTTQTHFGQFRIGFRVEPFDLVQARFAVDAGFQAATETGQMLPRCRENPVKVVMCGVVTS
ncbi:hypothetical protein SAMN05428995_10974 [Loktanella sp. DSM 29012]|nr:hypothetical protein SAMN05428995_10974 [Loktanella sp. DSM 29012]